ncbi:hypothetical protein LCGC14_2898200, partial [marine sediment metagenome]
GRYLKDRFRAIKLITGYEWDNTHLYLKNTHGDLYAISFNEIGCPNGSINYKKYSKLFHDNLMSNNIVEFHIWTQGGTCTIYGKVFMIKSFISCIPESIMVNIKDSVNSYSKDKTLSCSDCGVKIHHKTDEVGGHYFAGIYCNSCWNRHWKAVEAKETYN